MFNQTRSTLQIVRNCVLGALLLTPPLAAWAGNQTDESQAEPVHGGRAMSVSIEAVVTAIDPETRQISLKGPQGNVVTLTAGEEIGSLDKINVGDRVSATYVAAVEGELREPTEEELAEPWVVLQEAVTPEAGEPPAVGRARLIRAVCTIEGMNRSLGTVTLRDPNGRLHVVGHVEPEKMDGVTLGQTVVVVYTEALALSLEERSEGEEGSEDAEL
jgi:hypothetical protein